ncbi:hypothetical protein NT6N_16600 [Oceaniferula spumae]|uniref:endo-1,4-beta-xylanase n=1 Tax=Oceaniferula spumae TaxID=2979115 RepID=A0AAT9FKX1_9BACT
MTALVGIAQEQVVRDVAVSMDAWVNSAPQKAGINFGSKTEIRLKENSKIGYLQFDLTGIPAGVIKAELHFHSIDYTGNVAAHSVDDNEWDEYSLTWNNRPAYSVAATGIGAVTPGNYGFCDVTSLISGNGTYSFALLAQGGIKGDLSTREALNGAFLRITYSSSNVAPIAQADEYYVYSAEARTVKYGVLENDRDGNDDPLTAIMIDAPEHGTLTLNEDGTFVYQAEAGYEGLDRFTYVARDLHDAGGAGQTSADSAVTEVILDVRGSGFLMPLWKKNKLESDLGITLGRDEELDLLWALHPISDTSWKDAAEQRIETNRLAEKPVFIKDANGNSVEGAEVILRMKQRSDFRFGGVLDLKQFTGDNTDDGIHGDAYKARISTFFDAVGLNNGLKPKLAAGNEHLLPEFFDWAADINMPVRGHLLLWPGGTHMSDTVTAIVEQIEASEDDNEIATLKVQLKAAVDAEITSWAQKWDVYEWDVLNEILSNNRIQNILGDEEMLRWYQLADQHKVDDDARLLLNDFQIISGKNDNRLGQFKTKLDYLTSGGANLGAIGFQSRFGWKREDPEEILRRLNEFNSYDLPLVGTEFEVKSKDGVFYPDELVRARATAEVMTVYFSHPKVDGLFAWDYALDSERGLLDNTGRPKLNGLVWYYLNRIEFVSRSNQTSGSGGLVTHRGYKGDYELVIRVGDEEHRSVVTLNSEAAVEIMLPFQVAESVTLGNVGDAFAMSNQPDQSTGGWMKMESRDDPHGNFSKDSYVKFDLNGRVLAGDTATLRLYSKTEVTGLKIYSVSDATWDESTLTWTNKPTFGALLGTVNIAANSWAEVEVTLPPEQGVVSFGLRTPDDSLVVLGSKEGGQGAELKILEAHGDLDDDGVSDAFDPDDDNDLVPDSYEARHGLRPREFDALTSNKDSDGTPTALEYAMGLNPLSIDNGPFDISSDGPNISLTYMVRDGLNTLGAELRLRFSLNLEDWHVLTPANLAAQGVTLNSWGTTSLKDAEGNLTRHTINVTADGALFLMADYGPMRP